MTENEAKDLREAHEALLIESQRLQKTIEELQWKLMVKEAHAFVAEVLAEKDMPEPTRKRLLGTLATDPIHDNGVLNQEAYRKVIEEAAKKEMAYLASVSEKGQIRGMGETPQPPPTETLFESFKSSWIQLGKTPEEAEFLAKIAANGR